MSRAKGNVEAYEKAYTHLQKELAQTGFLWVGTVLRQRHACRKPGCRCARGGRFRHGPYYVWTRKIQGKTVTRMLSEPEGRLYTQWIQNRRGLSRTIKKMMAMSKRLAPFLLRGAVTP
jgi:hypothetical protein